MSDRSIGVLSLSFVTFIVGVLTGLRWQFALIAVGVYLLAMAFVMGVLSSEEEE